MSNHGRGVGMSDTALQGSDLVLVSQEKRGAALRARAERIGIPIGELADRVGISREQLGKILSDKVPGSRSLGKIERVLDEIDAEHGRAPTQTSRGAGQIEIEAEGVFGIDRIIIRGDQADAEESFAALIERLRKGEGSPKT